LQFLINKIGVKGKIGVYGRSIGGIAASHLVAKFPNYITAFIGDRTMGNLDNLIVRRYYGGENLLGFYRFLSCLIKVNNG
jgi:hypothetical protein